MAKQGTATATPRLRFPKFKDAPRWECTTLSHACEMQAGKFIAASEIFETPDEAAYPCYGGNGLRGYTATFTHSGRYPLIGRQGALCGNIQFARGDFYATEHALVSSPKPGIHVDWLFYALNGLELNRFATGQAQPGLSVDVLKSVPCAIPRDEGEQQKIADCLTSLYEVIAAQGRKVEALKAHKRGLMQQLFPREGETRPRLRFPEFRDAAEWITRPLGELMVIGSSRRVHESDWTTAGVPFYRAREIVAIGKGEPINPLFISEALYAEFSGFTGEIEEGQLLVTGVGSIGIPYLVKSDDRFYFKDGNIIWLKNSQADLSGGFLFRLFEAEYVKSQIATMAGIGTVGTYTIENAKRTLAVFPVDKCEQQRIADCLSSLDTQITAESNRLAALKIHKQGLMQQLFPAPDAATA